MDHLARAAPSSTFSFEFAAVTDAVSDAVDPFFARRQRSSFAGIVYTPKPEEGEVELSHVECGFLGHIRQHRRPP